MGFETCRMTCEETQRLLVDMLRPPKTGTMQVSEHVTATFVAHGEAPPKSRGEEIAEKMEGDWIEEIPVSVIADAIDKAIAEERKACAEIVRRFCGDIGSCDAERIAKAIRERGTK